MARGKILSNKIQCLHCGEIIESTKVHEMKWCKCGQCAVDGGLSYIKRAYKTKAPEEAFIDLAVFEGDEE